MRYKTVFTITLGLVHTDGKQTRTWTFSLKFAVFLLYKCLLERNGHQVSRSVSSGGSRVSQRGANPKEVPKYYLTNFPQKILENEEILASVSGVNSETRGTELDQWIHFMFRTHSSWFRLHPLWSHWIFREKLVPLEGSILLPFQKRTLFPERCMDMVFCSEENVLLI